MSTKRPFGVIVNELCGEVDKIIPLLYSGSQETLRALLKETRAAMRKTQKRLAVMRDAAAKSGKSGRPNINDESRRREIANMIGTLAEVAGQVGVSRNTVKKYRLEFGIQ